MDFGLPKLPDLAAANRKQLNLVVAPSGTGWGFTPDRGWDYDAAWDSFIASVGGGGLPGGQGSGGGGGGPSFTWDVGVGGVTAGSGTGPGGTTVTGTPGGIRNTTTSVLDLFGAIPWSRIAALLLGLILIIGGIYLIKPVQQAVVRTVKSVAA